MSDAGLIKRGRPDALVEASHLLFRYCGGLGGGGCLEPVTGQFTTFLIEVPKFIVYNRRITFLNKEVSGIRFFNDAGPDGLGCDHSLGGTEFPFWVAFSDAGSGGSITAEQIERRGIQLSGELPYTFDVPAEYLPQPVLPGGGANPDWTAVIYVHILWKVPGLINAGGDIGPHSFKIVKHDYDVVL